MHQLNGMLRSKYMISSVPIYLNRISLIGRKLSPMTNCFRKTKSTFPGSLENQQHLYGQRSQSDLMLFKDMGRILSQHIKLHSKSFRFSQLKAELKLQKFYSWVIMNPKYHMLQMDSYLKFRSHTSDKVCVWWVEIAELKGLLSSI